MAAVTVTTRLFVPPTKPVRPAIVALALASVGVATTATDVVPAGRLTDEPFATEVPFTVNTERVLSLLSAATARVTV